MALEKHTQTTNARLANWYSNAKLDYGVIGQGEATVVGNFFVINYIENGELKTWSMRFWKEERYDLDYFYNVWMEQAR